MESASPNPSVPAAPPLPRWLRIAGIRRRQGRFIHFTLSLWGWVLAAALVFMAGSAGFAEYSMQPDFCRSCHLMEPYYQAWHKSTHRNVPCSDCHFEPGLTNTFKGKFQASSQAVKYLTKTYGSKPHAEVRDSSCMRDGCHERRLLEGKVNWQITTQDGQKISIRFDHTPHLTQVRRGKQLRCVSCHSQIVQGQHIVVTLDTCFLCHFKGLKHGRDDETLGGCRACHDAPQGEIRLTTGLFKHSEFLDRGVSCQNCHADTIRGDGAVPRQRCWDCHNQPDQIARYDQPQLLHQVHITEHKVECSSCHIKIEHFLNAAAPQGPQMLLPHAGLGDAGSCGQCHEQSHTGPADLYRGTGGVGVPDMPSPMYRAQVKCIACHEHAEESAGVAQVVGQTYRAGQDRCDYCHGSKYPDTLSQWKTGLDQNLAHADQLLAGASAAVAKARLSDSQHLAVQRLLDDAEHNIRLVRLGHGVHNITYATALLSVAADRAAQASTLIKQESASTGPSP
jgi:nitrate/TMAO reductase-like tetraheme cytochrome c subunit